MYIYIYIYIYRLPQQAHRVLLAEEGLEDAHVVRDLVVIIIVIIIIVISIMITCMISIIIIIMVVVIIIMFFRGRACRPRPCLNQLLISLLFVRLIYCCVSFLLTCV